MTKRNSTKRAFVASAMALLLCVAMLAGSTLAWFTDSVTVSGNKIKAGTFDIELWQTTYKDWMDQPGEEGFVEKNITDSTEPIFLSELWEPGFLAYTNLTVKNVGTLAAKINATLVPVGEVGKLAEVIDVYVAYVPFADMYDSYTIRQFFNGEYVLPWGGGMNMFDSYVVKVGTLAEVMANGTNLAEYEEMDAVIEAGDEYQVNIALKVQESAGNEYQAAEAGIFDIRIVATQATVETDDFDDQYDAAATYPVVDQTEFDAALDAAQAGDTISLLSSGTYTLPSNLPDGVNIDGNGATVEIPKADQYSRLYAEDTVISNAVIAGSNIVTSGSISFVGCTFDGNLDNAVPSDLVSFTDCTFNANVHFASGSGAEVAGSNFVATDCVFNKMVTLADFENATFTGCEFYGNNWAGKNVITYVNVGVNTFEDCTFTTGIRASSGLTAEDFVITNCNITIADVSNLS